MKKLLGFFALLLFVFNAPVSFACDGPQTTKESCFYNVDVIDITEDIAVSNDLNLIEFDNDTIDSVYKSNTFEILSYQVVDLFEKPKEYCFLSNKIYIHNLFLVDYGINKALNKNLTKGYLSFTNKNCRTRQLPIS